MRDQNEKKRDLKKTYDIYVKRSAKVFGVSLESFWEKYNSGVFRAEDQFKRQGENKWKLLAEFLVMIDQSSSTIRNADEETQALESITKEFVTDCPILESNCPPVEHTVTGATPGWWSNESSLRNTDAKSKQKNLLVIPILGVGGVFLLLLATFWFMQTWINNQEHLHIARNGSESIKDTNEEQITNEMKPGDNESKMESGAQDAATPKSDESETGESTKLENSVSLASESSVDLRPQKATDPLLAENSSEQGGVILSPIPQISKENSSALKAVDELKESLDSESIKTGGDPETASSNETLQKLSIGSSKPNNLQAESDRTTAIFEFYRSNFSELRLLSEKIQANFKETVESRNALKASLASMQLDVQAVVELELKIESYRQSLERQSFSFDQAKVLRNQRDALTANSHKLKARIVQTKSSIESSEKRITFNEGAAKSFREQQTNIAAKGYEQRINLLENIDLFGEIDLAYHRQIENRIGTALILEPDFVVGHLIYGFSCFRLEMMDEVKRSLDNIEKARAARTPEAKLLNEKFFVIEEELRLFLQGLLQCHEGKPQPIANELSRFFQAYKKHPDLDLGTTKWIQAKVFFKLGRTGDALDCLKAGLKARLNDKRLLRNGLRLCREESANSDNFLSLRTTWAKALEDIVGSNDKLSWMEIAKTWIALKDREAALMAIEKLERIDDQELASEVNKLKTEIESLD